MWVKNRDMAINQFPDLSQSTDVGQLGQKEEYAPLRENIAESLYYYPFLQFPYGTIFLWEWVHTLGPSHQSFQKLWEHWLSHDTDSTGLTNLPAWRLTEVNKGVLAQINSQCAHWVPETIWLLFSNEQLEEIMLGSWKNPYFCSSLCRMRTVIVGVVQINVSC